jgi:uncharacterized membrane protein YeaQ/YmgE (transglycosylase-associated protein family)
MGGGFLVLGLLTLIITSKPMYFLVSAGFLLYSVIGLIGALLNQIPFQSAIFSLGIALYTLWSFPEEPDAN